MQYRDLHPWDITSEKARQLQNELRTQVIRIDRFGKINTVAGVDIGLRKDIAIGIRGSPQLSRNCRCWTSRSPKVLFVFLIYQGLLSFREIPPLLTAFETAADRTRSPDS